MKLVYCTECSDIFSLRYERKSCFCGKSFGQYSDPVNAIIGGPCIPMGINNRTFINSLQQFKENRNTEDFVAFFIDHKSCNTICGLTIKEVG